jgi:hypothetical protein
MRGSVTLGKLRLASADPPVSFPPGSGCDAGLTQPALTQLQAAPYMASLELLESAGCGLRKIWQVGKVAHLR